MTEEGKGIAAVSGQTAVVIAAYFFAKETLHDIPVAPLVLMRSCGAALILGAVVWWQGDKRPTSWSDLARLAALGIVAVPLNQGLFLWGLSKTTASHAGLLYALTPAVVLMLRVWHGAEKASTARICGIGLALAGVLVVLSDSARTPAGTGRQAGADPFTGDLIILCAVLSWAAYTAYSAGVVQRLGTVRATAGTLSFGALFYAPIGGWLWWSSGWQLSSTPPGAWLGLAWLVVMSSVVAYLAWYYAIRRLDPSRVAVFNNLQPLGTAAGQWGFFHLPLGPAFLAGGALAIAGVVLAQRSQPKPVAPGAGPDASEPWIADP